MLISFTLSQRICKPSATLALHAILDRNGDEDDNSSATRATNARLFRECSGESRYPSAADSRASIIPEQSASASGRYVSLKSSASALGEDMIRLRQGIFVYRLPGVIVMVCDSFKEIILHNLGAAFERIYNIYQRFCPTIDLLL